MVSLRLSLVSGAIKVSDSESMKKKIRNAMHAGLNRAYKQLLHELTGEGGLAAMDSGKFRRALTKMFDAQVDRIQNSDSFSIFFQTLQETTKERYFRYHVKGPHGLSPRSRYKKPHTPGTRPVNERHVILRFKSLTKKFLDEEFTTEGFDWTNFARLS